MSNLSTLSEIIDKKANSMDVQISRAKPMKPDEVAWVRHKELVKGLTGNYIAVLTEKVEKDFNRVKKTYYPEKKSTIYIINFPEYSERYKTVLEIVEHEVNGIVSVCYLANNPDTNTQFIKDIIGKKFK